MYVILNKYLLYQYPKLLWPCWLFCHDYGMQIQLFLILYSFINNNYRSIWKLKAVSGYWAQYCTKWLPLYTDGERGLVICKLSLVSNIYHGTSLHCALEHVDDTVDMSQIDEMNLKWIYTDLLMYLQAKADLFIVVANCNNHCCA